MYLIWVIAGRQFTESIWNSSQDFVFYFMQPFASKLCL